MIGGSLEPTESAKSQ